MSTETTSPPLAGHAQLPSRAATIVVTLLLGPVGLIPAFVHGSRAERLGASSRRYWVAFAVSLAIAAVVYGGLLALGLAFLSSVGSMDGTSSFAAPPTEDAPPVHEPVTPNGSWSLETITPLLDEFADDEADGGAFTSDMPEILVPCGGQWQHGVSTSLIEATSGGVAYTASAEIMFDAAGAAVEFSRLGNLAAGCGPFDSVTPLGEPLARCSAPVVDAPRPVLRYRQECDDEPGAPRAVAIIQVDNAVVAVSAPSTAELDAALPPLLADLQVN